MRETFDAAVGLIHRDWLTFSSYRTQLLSMSFGLLTSLTLYYFLSRLVHVSTFQSSDAYFAFVVVGMVILQVLNSTVGIANTLRNELVAGTFERLVPSPFGAVKAMVSMMLFPFIMSLIQATMILVLAALVFGVSLRSDTAALAIPIAILGTGVFTAFGMFFAATTLVFKRAVGGLGLVVTIVTLTSGLYFPITLLPGYIRWISSVQPFTPAVDLLRNVLVGTPLTDPAWFALTKLIGFLIVMVPVGFGALQLALRTAQRRGTIIEY